MNFVLKGGPWDEETVVCNAGRWYEFNNIDTGLVSRYELDYDLGIGVFVNDYAQVPTQHLDTIQTERQSVYGDPLKNHHGIAMMWATLLAPWWERIRDYEPIPPHVVALMMSALKLNRMRLGFKEDNYDDLAIYADRFAKEWQANKDTWGKGHDPDPNQ